MSDIVTFLNARLDEDQAAAEAAQAVDPGPWTVEVEKDWRGDDANTNWRPGHGAATVVAADGNPLWEPSSYTSSAGEQCMTVPTAQHVANHDPARVLREVKAKREIVQFCNDDPPFVEGGYVYTSRVLQLLAAAYSDHPDYDPSWAA